MCVALGGWVLRIRVGPTGRAMRHLDTQPEDPVPEQAAAPGRAQPAVGRSGRRWPA